MKDLKEIILEKRVREFKVDGKKVPDKYIAVFNDYLKQIAEKLKTHDRELVKEVCEKIRKTIASTVDLAESNQQIKDQFHIILDLVEKGFEK